MRVPGWPEVCGAVAVLGPFVIRFERTSSQTVNGVVVSSSHWNPIPLVGGVLGLGFAVLAMACLSRTAQSAKLARALVAGAVMVAACLHIIAGAGAFRGDKPSAEPRLNSPLPPLPSRPSAPMAPLRTYTADDCIKRGRGCAKVFKGLEAKCKTGDALACSNAGYFREKGLGVSKDLNEEARLYTRGCALRNEASCRNLSTTVLKVAPDAPLAANARRTFAQACKRNIATGCAALGIVAARGVGGKDDPGQARTASARACALGSAIGCVNYGESLRQLGAMQPTALVEARTVFGKACDLGDLDGCNGRAILLAYGKGGPRQLPAALAIWQSACTKNHGWSCYNLRRNYATGGQKWKHYVSKACRLKLQPACAELKKL